MSYAALTQGARGSSVATNPRFSNPHFGQVVELQCGTSMPRVRMFNELATCGANWRTFPGPFHRVGGQDRRQIAAPDHIGDIDLRAVPSNPGRADRCKPHRLFGYATEISPLARIVVYFAIDP